jgi:hypothetical protein
VPLHGFGHEKPSGLISDPDLIHPCAIICGLSYIYIKKEWHVFYLLLLIIIFLKKKTAGARSGIK